MILLLDTSTATCRLSFVDEDRRYEDYWEAGRELAHGLLGYLQEQLAAHDASWHDISGIGVFRGPGSFTGLRIGITVLNTLADSLQVPIIGVTGDSWMDDAQKRLKMGENDRIVLPFYGGDATITTPRK